MVKDIMKLFACWLVTSSINDKINEKSKTVDIINRDQNETKNNINSEDFTFNEDFIKKYKTNKSYIKHDTAKKSAMNRAIETVYNTSILSPFNKRLIINEYILTHSLSLVKDQYYETLIEIIESASKNGMSSYAIMDSLETWHKNF